MGERFNIGLLVEGKLSEPAKSALLRCVLTHVESLIGKLRSAATTNLQSMEFCKTEWAGDLDHLPEPGGTDGLVHLYSGDDSARFGSVALQTTKIGLGLTIALPSEPLRRGGLDPTEQLMKELYHCVTHSAVLIGGFEQEIDLDLSTFENAVEKLFEDNSLTVIVVGPSALLPRTNSEFLVSETGEGMTVLRHRFAQERMALAVT